MQKIEFSVMKEQKVSSEANNQVRSEKKSNTNKHI